MKKKIMSLLTLLMMVFASITTDFCSINSYAAGYHQSVQFKQTVTSSDKKLLYQGPAFRERTLIIYGNSSNKPIIISMYNARGKCLWSSDWSGLYYSSNNVCYNLNIGSDVSTIKVRTKNKKASTSISYYFLE